MAQVQQIGRVIERGQNRRTVRVTGLQRLRRFQRRAKVIIDSLNILVADGGVYMQGKPSVRHSGIPLQIDLRRACWKGCTAVMHIQALDETAVKKQHKLRIHQVPAAFRPRDIGLHSRRFHTLGVHGVHEQHGTLVLSADRRCRKPPKPGIGISPAPGFLNAKGSKDRAIRL